MSKMASSLDAAVRETDLDLAVISFPHHTKRCIYVDREQKDRKYFFHFLFVFHSLVP